MDRGKTLRMAKLKVKCVTGSAFAAMARRKRKEKHGVKVFAVSMADIKKALRPKYRPTREKI